MNIQFIKSTIGLICFVSCSWIFAQEEVDVSQLPQDLDEPPIPLEVQTQGNPTLSPEIDVLRTDSPSPAISNQNLKGPLIDSVEERNQMLELINERLRREIEKTVQDKEHLERSSKWSLLAAGGGIAIVFLLVGYLLGRRQSQGRPVL